MNESIIKLLSILICFTFVTLLCSCSEDSKSLESETFVQTTEAAKTKVPTTLASTTATPTTQETSASEPVTEKATEIDTAWKDAYIEYIDDISIESDVEKFALIDLDENNIPELFYSSGFVIKGGSFSSFSNGQINTFPTGSEGVSYLNNRVCCVGGRQGTHSKTVYAVTDGTIECIFQGLETSKTVRFDMDNPNDFTYSFRTDNDSEYQNVTYEEYMSRFSNAFDINKESNFNWVKDRSQIIDAIQNY